MKKINCIIVEDEPQARRLIESYVSRFPDLHVSGSAKNAVEAMALLETIEVDLMFLDINMPKISGLELLKGLATPPVTIITTAYTEHALESYDYDVADYLLKPIRFERFEKAIEKAKRELTLRKEITDPTLHVDSIEFKIDGANKIIAFDEILYFQSVGNYLKIVTPSKKYLTLKTTKETEESLPKQLFMRIHKSFIINIRKVSEAGADFIFVGKDRLPIGKTYKKYFNEYFQNKLP